MAKLEKFHQTDLRVPTSLGIVKSEGSVSSSTLHLGRQRSMTTSIEAISVGQSFF